MSGCVLSEFDRDGSSVSSVPADHTVVGAQHSPPAAGVFSTSRIMVADVANTPAAMVAATLVST